jgi:hypothetical protein
LINFSKTFDLKKKLNYKELYLIILKKNKINSKFKLKKKSYFENKLNFIFIIKSIIRNLFNTF